MFLVQNLGYFGPIKFHQDYFYHKFINERPGIDVYDAKHILLNDAGK